MKQILTIFIVLTMSCTGHVVRAETIPDHLAAMARQLYQDTEKQLESSAVSVPQKEVLERSMSILRDAGVKSWTKTAPRLEGIKDIADTLKLDLKTPEGRQLMNAFLRERLNFGTAHALKSLAAKTGKEYSEEQINTLVPEIDTAMGKAVEGMARTTSIKHGKTTGINLEWEPEHERFVLEVTEDGKDGEEPFKAALVGDVFPSMAEDGTSLELNTAPSRMPFRSLLEDDLKEIDQTILGEWEAEDGTKYNITADGEKAGIVDKPKALYDRQITDIKDQIKGIKANKFFEWKNIKTGKIVIQNKFKRLDESFEYIGEKYAHENAEAEIARLEDKITSLEAERDGKTKPPSQAQDPTGYDDIAKSSAGRAVTVTVTRRDGYSYTYDQAVFDGKRLSARRTQTKIQDIDNPGLPALIKQKLISDGWNPPEWFEAEAMHDIDTNTVKVRGKEWSMHVTYGKGAFGLGEMEVKGINDPYVNRNIALRRPGGDELVTKPLNF